MKTATQLSGHTDVESAGEATVGPVVKTEQQEIERKKILDSQYKCFEKINRAAPYNKSGRDMFC